MRECLESIASLKLTLAAMCLLALATVAIYQQWVLTTVVLAFPLGLLSLNLAAALLVTPKLRAQAPLAVFHLSLLALIVFAMLGRLTYLRGHLELADGVPFAGEITVDEQGPFHPGSLADVHILSEGFTIDYARTVKRGPTRNLVSWQEPGGRLQKAVIGDQTPLLVAGYRLYTSFNKGFALVIEWTPAGQEPALGAVHLPAYPAHEFNQAREWLPPGSESSLWFMLDFDEVILDPSRESQFRPPRDYHLVVRDGEQRNELRAGEVLNLPSGNLRFIGLRSWMGYSVFYDWTLPWIAATSALIVLSLCAHFYKKFSQRPWDA